MLVVLFADRTLFTRGCVLCFFCVCFLFFFFFFLFFFQAEDGIRYLVRSRGLGDVYKRQVLALQLLVHLRLACDVHVGDEGSVPPLDGERSDLALEPALLRWGMAGVVAVSYTHLTLPTSDLG